MDRERAPAWWPLERAARRSSPGVSRTALGNAPAAARATASALQPFRKRSHNGGESDRLAKVCAVNPWKTARAWRSLFRSNHCPHEGANRARRRVAGHRALLLRAAGDIDAEHAEPRRH